MLSRTIQIQETFASRRVSRLYDRTIGSVNIREILNVFSNRVVVVVVVVVVIFFLLLSK